MELEKQQIEQELEIKKKKQMALAEEKRVQFEIEKLSRQSEIAGLEAEISVLTKRKKAVTPTT